MEKKKYAVAHTLEIYELILNYRVDALFSDNHRDNKK